MQTKTRRTSRYLNLIIYNSPVSSTHPSPIPSSDSERQSYKDRSKAFIKEFIAAHPDSEFAKAQKPSTSSTADAAADSDEASTAEPAAKLKNKMLDGLMPSFTSTPKRALGKPEEEEEESDEDDSEDGSGSENER